MVFKQKYMVYQDKTKDKDKDDKDGFSVLDVRGKDCLDRLPSKSGDCLRGWSSRLRWYHACHHWRHLTPEFSANSGHFRNGNSQKGGPTKRPENGGGHSAKVVGGTAQGRRNLLEDPTIKSPMIKRIKEKSLLASIAKDPRVNNEEQIRIIRTTNVVSKTATRLRHMSSIPTWQSSKQEQGL